MSDLAADTAKEKARQAENEPGGYYYADALREAETELRVRQSCIDLLGQTIQAMERWNEVVRATVPAELLEAAQSSVMEGRE